MSFANAYRSELLKTKRTSSFWLSLLGAGFIPAVFTAIYLSKPDDLGKAMGTTPWEWHFMYCWNAMASFLLPMYVILICALVPQIEYRNNAWKQVFASPQSYGKIYFSKFFAIHTMILFCFVSFNLFTISCAVLSNLVHAQYAFFDHPINWTKLLSLNVKMYIATLGIAAIQYCLSLRLKNFIAPVGIGLALLIGGIIATGFGWKHVYKIPFAQPNLTLMWLGKEPAGWLQPHEWNALITFAIFTLLGFLDMTYRKEKG